MLSINQNIQQVDPSATFVINERNNNIVKSGKEVYKLGFEQSPFPDQDKMTPTEELAPKVIKGIHLIGEWVK